MVLIVHDVIWAEELPFAAVWCIEQVIGTAPVLESVTTLTYAAGITQRLRLGIAVLLIAQRNPVDLAKFLSSLDVLSNGRLIIGVGLGQNTRFYPAYGLAPEGRVARFRENLAIMKRLWTEQRVTLDGRFSHLESIPMEPKPIQIKQLPPNFPKAKRLYLSLGDNLPRLREWFGAFYGKPEMAEQVAVWGSPRQIADQMVRLGNAGVNHVLLNPVFDEEAQMEQICQDVLPHV